MITALKNSLLIDGGSWYTILDDVYLGTVMVKKWKKLLTKIEWIENDKIRIYIYTKLIRGDNIHTAFNKVFSKAYFKDPDYLRITPDSKLA